VAARGNFCTIDEQGIVQDRRAGRISSDKNQDLLSILREIELPGIQIFLEVVKEHRFLLVLRGPGLSDALEDTDPLVAGKKPREPMPFKPEAERTAELVSRFLEEARLRLAHRRPANMVLLRGFARRPVWPLLPEIFQLKAVGIAAYPMYRGLAKLVGMDVLKTRENLGDPFLTLRNVWADFDFFFVHFKPIDSAGEDGDFKSKVKLIEEVDLHLPKLLQLDPDVVIITGDHSTPAKLASHSWHPVPVLLWSRYCRPDRVESFGEHVCLKGSLGTRFPAMDLMPLALAHARRLKKYGA
jgi:2,3-bisphosphoglycerate-independent phosphoglycerate mutase